MEKSKTINENNDEQAQQAVRALIKWAGDDPDRPGMDKTPQRVLDFYRAFFKGYGKTASDYSASIANDVEYDDFILVKDIQLQSFCEHHLLPATGIAHIAYIPDENVAGLGTIARIIDDCARRFTTQEAIINDAVALIEQAFAPNGIALYAELSHGCMTIREPALKQSKAVATKFTGDFQNNPDIQKQFFMLINKAHD